MKVYNKNTAPKLWTALHRLSSQKNRNRRAYVNSANPGKPKHTSIPLVYLIKSIKLQEYKKLTRELLNKKSITINGNPVRDKNCLVGLLDYLVINNLEELKTGTKQYQLYFEDNKDLKIKSYPCLKPVLEESKFYPVKKWFSEKNGKINVQTFQGLNFLIENNAKNLEELKQPLCFLIRNNQNQLELKNFSSNLELVQLIKLTGKSRLYNYQILSLEKQGELWKIKLKDLKTNKISSSKMSFLEIRSKFTFFLKKSISIV